MMIGYLGREENCIQNTNQIQADKGRMKGSGEEGKGGMRQSYRVQVSQQGKSRYEVL